MFTAKKETWMTNTKYKSTKISWSQRLFRVADWLFYHSTRVPALGQNDRGFIIHKLRFRDTMLPGTDCLLTLNRHLQFPLVRPCFSHRLNEYMKATPAECGFMYRLRLPRDVWWYMSTYRDNLTPIL